MLISLDSWPFLSCGVNHSTLWESWNTIIMINAEFFAC